MKYDRDITPHPHLIHSTHSHAAAKPVHRKWGRQMFESFKFDSKKILSFTVHQNSLFQSTKWGRVYDSYPNDHLYQCSVESLTAQLGVDFTHVLYEFSIHTQHNQHVDLFRIKKRITLMTHVICLRKNTLTKTFSTQSPNLTLRTGGHQRKPAIHLLVRV